MKVVPAAETSSPATFVIQVDAEPLSHRALANVAAVASHPLMLYPECRLAYAQDGTPFLTLPLRAPSFSHSQLLPSLANIHAAESNCLPSLAEALAHPLASANLP